MKALVDGAPTDRMKAMYFRAFLTFYCAGKPCMGHD